MDEEKENEKKLEVQKEGAEAFDALFEEFRKDGIDRSRIIEDLQQKVAKLTIEVEVLKELVSRALNIKETEILKD